MENTKANLMTLTEKFPFVINSREAPRLAHRTQSLPQRFQMDAAT
ncbi:MAG: hypothetical protein ACYTXC_20750 [Nostoc sp.]